MAGAVFVGESTNDQLGSFLLVDDLVVRVEVGRGPQLVERVLHLRVLHELHALVDALLRVELVPLGQPARRAQPFTLKNHPKNSP